MLIFLLIFSLIVFEESPPNLEFLSKSQKEHSLTSTWKQTLPKEQLKEELRQQLILKVSKGLSNHFSTFFSSNFFFGNSKSFSYIHTHILSIFTFLYGVQSSLFSILLKLVFAKKCMYVVRNFLHRKINLEIVHFRIYFNQSFNLCVHTWTISKSFREEKVLYL